MCRQFGNTTVEVVEGDITKEDVDAVVNAANESLRGGGGVDGAIHAVGGVAILKECILLGGCDTGDAKITTAGRMPARHVIHTVGPVYRDGQHGEPVLLASCYRRSLEVALENKCDSVSFPAISCGVYGYPIPDAAAIAIETVKSFAESHGAPGHVRFVMFGSATFDAFRRALENA